MRGKKGMCFITERIVAIWRNRRARPPFCSVTHQAQPVVTEVVSPLTRTGQQSRASEFGSGTEELGEGLIPAVRVTAACDPGPPPLLPTSLANLLLKNAKKRLRATQSAR